MGRTTFAQSADSIKEIGKKYFNFGISLFLMLPCPFKYLTDFDCPGCGFQRAISALINGDLIESFRLYPAAIPVVLFVIISLSENFFMLKGLSQFRTVALAISVVLIIGAYSLKLFHYASA